MHIASPKTVSPEDGSCAQQSLVFNFSMLGPGEVSAPWTAALSWRRLCDSVFLEIVTVSKCLLIPQACGGLTELTGTLI